MLKPSHACRLQGFSIENDQCTVISVYLSHGIAKKKKKSVGATTACTQQTAFITELYSVSAASVKSEQNTSGRTINC